ncbi:MAG TPA: hypothetical protein VMU07_02620, partial [Candidatus Paceibacterota bacterium]|nr:hypothetical protein [Candidatus Paceibacterota bacterium]
PKQYSWKVFRVLRFTGELTPSVETIPEWVNVVDLSKHQLLPNVSNAVAEALAQGFENHPMSKQEGVA